MNSPDAHKFPADIQAQRDRRARRQRWGKRGFIALFVLPVVLLTGAITWHWRMATAHANRAQTLNAQGLEVTSRTTAPVWFRKAFPNSMEQVFGFRPLDAWQTPYLFQPLHESAMKSLRFQRRYGSVTDQSVETIADNCPATILLNLSGTAITNDSIRSIGELKQLQTLVLRNTSISDDGFDELADLTSLQVVDLSDTKISAQTLRYLAPLKSLESLALSRTKLSGDDLNQLAAFPELQQVNLDGLGTAKEPLTDLSAIPDSLVFASLANATVRPVAKIGEFLGRQKLLGLLNLSNTATTDTEFRAVNSSALSVLSMAGCPITDASLEHLQLAKWLSCLDLAGTKITGSGLEFLPARIQILALDSQPIHNADLTHLPVSVVALFLSNTDVDNECLPHLNLPKLQQLSLAGTKVDDEFCESLVNSPLGEQIFSLDLSDTQVSSDCFQFLNKLPALATLKLNDIDLSDSAEQLRELAESKTLIHLTFENCGLGDAEFRAVMKTPWLERIRLGGNNISDAALDGVKFERAPGNCLLDLSDNPITDAGLKFLTDSRLHVNLHGTRVTRHGLKKYQANRANVGQWLPRIRSRLEICDEF